MPKILVPADVHLDGVKDESGKEPDLNFCKWFMLQTILNDPEWGRASSTMYTAMELRGLFKDAKPGDEIPLTKDQYEKLRARVESPTNAYNPVAMIHCKAFLDAVLEPKEK